VSPGRTLEPRSRPPPPGMMRALAAGVRSGTQRAGRCRWRVAADRGRAARPPRGRRRTSATRRLRLWPLPRPVSPAARIRRSTRAVGRWAALAGVEARVGDTERRHITAATRARCASPARARSLSGQLGRVELDHRRASSNARVRVNTSRPARRVNAKSRIRSGARPCAISHATRADSVAVLPLPAPARINSGRWRGTVAGGLCVASSKSAAGGSPSPAHSAPPAS
jgi:hypothetical protein